MPTSGQLSDSEDKRFILTVEQLSCGGLNGMRIRACRSHTHPGQGHRSAGRGSGWSWSLGMWSNPRVRAAADCGETDRGGVREEIVGGDACGGKPGSRGSKAILLSHA